MIRTWLKNAWPQNVKPGNENRQRLYQRRKVLETNGTPPERVEEAIASLGRVETSEVHGPLEQMC